MLGMFQIVEVEEGEAAEGEGVVGEAEVDGEEMTMEMMDTETKVMETTMARRRADLENTEGEEEVAVEGEEDEEGEAEVEEEDLEEVLVETITLTTHWQILSLMILSYLPLVELVEVSQLEIII